MKYAKNKEFLTGMFFLLTTVIYSSQIPSIKRTTIAPVDSAFIPTIVAVVMGTLSIVQLVIAYRGIQNGVEQEAGDSVLFGKVVKTLGCSILFVALFKPLGFVPSSIIYLVLQMIVLAPKEDRNIKRFLLVAVIAVIVIYIIFCEGLNLMLPQGILTGIL